MQVIILAAGKSSRFYPYNTTHKSCIRLLGKTIIEHTIESVKKAGITDIILVVNSDGQIKSILKDGSAYGATITYVVQDTALGAGDALLKAKAAINGDFFVTWANRVEFHTFANDLEQAKKGIGEGTVLIKETENIEGVGVVTVEGDRLVDIIEKPDVTNSPSHVKILGVYFLPKQFLETLERVPKEHYSFEKALTQYAKEQIIRVVTTDKETVSLKYPWDILRIKNFLLQNIDSYRGKEVRIAESADIQGNVYIEDGVQIMEHATIKGPCYIGKNAYIGTNAILRNGVVIEEHVVVGANMEIKNSILFANTTTHSGFIGDSVIGQGCKIAAFFCSANVRLDRSAIEVTALGKHVNSHLSSLGVLMGDGVKAGIRVSTMPGVVIGRNVTIGPQTTVMHSIGDDMSYYTKFEEVVEKKKSAKGGSSSGRKKRFILLDIDNTLYDSSSFRKKLFEKVIAVLQKTECNDPVKLCEDIYSDLIREKGLFFPEDFIDTLQKYFQGKAMPKKELMEAMYDEEIASSFLYDETHDIVKEFEKIGELGIFSQGVERFQRLKLKQIAHLFADHHIHIVPSKLSQFQSIFAEYKNYDIFFLDDSLPILHAVKEMYPDVFTIWIKRGRYAENQEPIAGFSPDAIVTNLKQAEKIIKEKN